MYHFRLKSATMAINYLGNSRTVVVIPQGAEIAAIEVPDTRTGFEHSRLIEIEWDRKNREHVPTGSFGARRAREAFEDAAGKRLAT